MGKPKVMEFINGQMVKSMMDNGIMELGMEKEYGRELMVILILAIGNETKLMDMERILGHVVIDMMGNGILVKNKV